MSDEDRLARIDAVLPDRWDTNALRQGVAVCATLAIPFRIVGAVLDSDSSGLNAALFFAYLVFFVIGAGCAAWIQRSGLPTQHAIATAVGTAAFVEFVFVIVRIVRGTEINWFSIGFAMSLIFLCGIIGGVLGSRLQAQGFQPTSRR